jgi:hypothetical protein
MHKAQMMPPERIRRLRALKAMPRARSKRSLSARRITGVDLNSGSTLLLSILAAVLGCRSEMPKLLEITSIIAAPLISELLVQDHHLSPHRLYLYGTLHTNRAQEKLIFHCAFSSLGLLINLFPGTT